MRSAAIVAVVSMTAMAQATHASAQEAASPLAVRALVSGRGSLWPEVVRNMIAKPLSCSGANAQAPDSPISRALALLGNDVPADQTVVVHTARPSFVRSVATAWTDGATIIINDQSEPYLHACKDAIALAGAIAHESYHLHLGSDEASAYAEQLRVMRRLGAGRHDLDVVERGLRAVRLANQAPTLTKK